MSYRDKSRKSLTLPSGAKCTIRKFSPYDFLSAEFTPSTIPDPNAPEIVIDSETSDHQKQKLVSQIIHMRRTAVLKCCSPLEFEGEKLTVVDKRFTECESNEIAIDEVEREDLQAIMDAVIAFSGLTKAAQDAATPFPSESNASSERSPNGEALRETPDGNLVTAGG